MLIICDGMPRSASTWVYNVVLALLGGLHPPGQIHRGYDENIAHFLESMPPTASHAVVKCHQLDDRGRELAEAGEAKTIYTWRDPADAVVSCMRMFDYDFESSLAVIDSSLDVYHFHRRTNSALMLEYEQIVTNANEVVSGIAGYLGLGNSPDALHRVVEEASLERVKDRVESLADNERFIRASGLEYDPETLLHRGHVRDGGIGYGRGALTAEQVRQVDALLRRRSLPRR